MARNGEGASVLKFVLGVVALAVAVILMRTTEGAESESMESFVAFLLFSGGFVSTLVGWAELHPAHRKAGWEACHRCGVSFFDEDTSRLIDDRSPVYCEECTAYRAQLAADDAQRDGQP